MKHAIFALFACWACWVLFVCIMRLQMLRDAGQLTIGQKILGYPTLVVGLVLDVALNWLVCTVLFLEFPRETTVSARLWRHSNDDPGWRQKLALIIRQQLLDTADPRGIHRG